MKLGHLPVEVPENGMAQYIVMCPVHQQTNVLLQSRRLAFYPSMVMSLCRRRAVKTRLGFLNFVVAPWPN